MGVPFRARRLLVAHEATKQYLKPYDLAVETIGRASARSAVAADAFFLTVNAALFDSKTLAH